MKVTVEFKAGFARFSRSDSLELEISEFARAIDLVELLVERGLLPFAPRQGITEEQFRANALVIVGNEIVSMDRVLHEGDVVGIYPILSGG